MSAGELLGSYGRVKIVRGSSLPIYRVEGCADALELVKTLLGDEALEEIMYNGPAAGLRVYHRELGHCFVEPPTSEEGMMRVIEYLLGEMGRGVEHPVVEGQLGDGSRVSVVLRPVAVDGPYFSVRKFPKKIITLGGLVRGGMLSGELAAFLWTLVDGLGRRPANILIAGGTSTGKTTLLMALAQLIPPSLRVVVIEDTPELLIEHPNVTKLTTPPIGSPHRIEMQDLLKASLRLRPDRIIVGEVRGKEAETLLTAMNTGHLGSMGTIHANNSHDAVKRLTSPPMDVPPSMLEALDIIITLGRVGGDRKVLEVAEVESAEQRGVRLNVLYRYDQTAGLAVKTGVPSAFISELLTATGMNMEKFLGLIHQRVNEIPR
jgi:flagellar protein FlaI